MKQNITLPQIDTVKDDYLLLQILRRSQPSMDEKRQVFFFFFVNNCKPDSISILAKMF